MLTRTCFIAATLIVLSCLSAQAQIPAATCSLHKDSNRFIGVCDWPDANVPVSLTLPEGADVWVGTMKPGFPEDPDAFSVHDHHGGITGVVKTPYGWFVLNRLALLRNALTVTFQPDIEVAPTVEDVRVLRRAGQILSGASSWNRQDNRTCGRGATRWSLYCAVAEAIQETVGQFHYRQPAMQVVRRVVGDVGRNRIKTHRLMDYNNHPDTTLQDLHSVLKAAADQIESDLRVRP